MDGKRKTVRGIAEETGLAPRTVHRTIQAETIGGCQLNTLALIGAALGVKTKKLYEEVESPALESPAED